VPDIYPVVCYADAAAAIDWLGKAFGFESLMVSKDNNGHIKHAELKVGDGILMLSGAPEKGKEQGPLSMTSPRPGEPSTQTIYIAIANPDAHHDRAKAAGAEIVMPLTNQSYGSREYAARDPQGHLWCFGTYRPEVKQA
jgi:uncharacterized glyoxalase superfamily protein PhnB